MPGNGTLDRTRQHYRSLTQAQLNALDLLAAGKSDKDTAEHLGLSRTRVAKWRLYDPVFQAALNQRRAEVVAVSLDRLRSLVPKALDVLAEELEKPENPHRLKAASEILCLGRLSPGSPGIGPTEPEEIVRRIVLEERRQAPGLHEELVEHGKALPPLERHLETTWGKIEAQLQEPEPE